MHVVYQVLFVFAFAIVSLTTYLVSFQGSIKSGRSDVSFFQISGNTTKVNLDKIIDAVSGNLFEMKERRKYTGKRLANMEKPSMLRIKSDERMCKYWAVITSINPPTTIVKQLTTVHQDLCVVVVADTKSPSVYDVDGDNLVYLTVKKQEKLKYSIMKLVPWNHFARKNVGFIYAIHHGAQRIFDVDDDNELISTINIIKQVFDYESREFDYVQTRQYVTNPYGIFMNKSDEFIWPRGYPLDAIKTKTDYRFFKENKTRSHNHIKRTAVVQFIQNVNPDLDAIYRITHAIPETFDESVTNCLILSKNSFAPFNAQSTVFNYNAFWGMLLPMTVHGRVSDIWRSFFTQKLLWSNSLHIAFCPALVNHIRNQHRLIKDFDAELPLYTQTESLLKYLEKWHSPSKSIPDRIEELYIDMYEKGILEMQDVQLAQMWIQDLQSVNYSFV